MDHWNIVKRAWRILWSYRALWIFGIILALTMSSANGGGGGSSGTSGIQFNGGDFDNWGITPPEDMQRELEQLGETLGRWIEGLIDADIVGEALPQRIVALVAAFCIFGLILAIVFTILRYISETALVKMVDRYEATGEKLTVGQGFRAGWSRPAWHFFLIDLVLYIPFAVVALLLLALAATPLFLWIFGETAVGVFGTIVAVGLFFLVILVLIVAGVIVGLVATFARRAAALEDRGVFDAIGRGFRVIWEHLLPVALMWLIVFGIRLAFTVAGAIVAVIFVIAGGLVGALTLFAIRGLVGLVAGVAAAWIVAGIIAGVVFFVILLIPLLFVGGLAQVFESTIWTLTFRDLTLPAVAGATVGIDPYASADNPPEEGEDLAV